jgi:hypothetical protein
MGGATVLPTTRTVPHWYGTTTNPQNGVTYGYNMVGADPNTCSGSACSVTVQADITPLIVHLDGMTFDGTTVVGPTLASPVFATNDYGSTPFATAAGAFPNDPQETTGPGGTLSQGDAGQALQLEDATMRAQFNKVGASSYHLMLMPNVLPAVTIDVPQNQGALYESGHGVIFPGINVNWWSTRIKNLESSADPTHLPIYLSVNEDPLICGRVGGQQPVIGLYNNRILARVVVGAGAHHLAFSPDWQQVWIALGQSASTIAILTTVVSRPPPPAGPIADPGRPHVVGRFHQGFLAHDLLFSPDGRRVWITSANTTGVGVFSARTRHLLFTVPAGAPPQHVAVEGQFAYITSGYGSLIEKVRADDGRVVARAHAPYGSFDLDAAAGYVVTASLLRGTLAIYDRNLRLLHVRQLAPSTEDLAISQP